MIIEVFCFDFAGSGLSDGECSLRLSTLFWHLAREKLQSNYAFAADASSVASEDVVLAILPLQVDAGISVLATTKGTTLQSS